MDIAALAMNMNQARLQQSASVSVVKMAIESAQGSSEDLEKLLNSATKNLEQVAESHLGTNLDVKY